MRAKPAYRLDGRIGWRAVILDHVSARHDALELTALPGTARPIAAPQGTFGGLSTPLSVAADGEDRLFILDAATSVLKRYDPCTERFDPLPCFSPAPVGLRKPMALALHFAGELLVLDAETRSVAAIALDTFRVKRRFGPFTWSEGRLWGFALTRALDPATGVPVDEMVMPAEAWDPRDLAVLPDGRLVVSDHAHGLVHVFDRRGHPCAHYGGVVGELPPLAKPTAIAVDRQGWIYMVEEGRSAVAMLDADGKLAGRTEDAVSLQDRFAAPAIFVDDDGTIWISNRRTGVVDIVRCDCAGQRLAPEPAPLTPAGCALLAFGPDGRAILGDPRSPCLMRSDSLRYAGAGRLMSEALDAGQAGAVWDRLALEGETPFGTRLVLSTAATDVALSAAEADDLPPDAWTSTPVRFDADGTWDCAIRSAPGRYLRLRLDFTSDGAATPRIASLTATSPRDTSVRYLPACFVEEPLSADFLARFMGLFDEMRADAFAPLDRLPAYFDPFAAPAAEQGAAGSDFLDWLAGWVGIALDRNWSVERRRRLVAEAPKLFRLRGTVTGLKRHVAIYIGAEPKVVEHFRLRRWLNVDEGRLDEGTLWGPEIVRRLQLDAYSNIGEFALIDGGDPLLDPFDAFANRATLYIPVGDGFSDADLAALEDVVELAKPAHVLVDIRLMRPRFVIGCDLVLGVNTVLGRDSFVAVTDQAVLGEDIRLAAPPQPFTLGAGVRLGVETILE